MSVIPLNSFAAQSMLASRAMYEYRSRLEALGYKVVETGAAWDLVITPPGADPEQAREVWRGVEQDMRNLVLAMQDVSK